jgi:hypothetical protein
MNHLIIKRQKLILEENILKQQVETCEMYQSSMFDFTVSQGKSFHRLTIEDILLAIHRLEINLRTELFHLKLEQALITSEIKVVEGAAKA